MLDFTPHCSRCGRHQTGRETSDTEPVRRRVLRVARYSVRGTSAWSLWSGSFLIRLRRFMLSDLIWFDLISDFLNLFFEIRLFRCHMVSTDLKCYWPLNGSLFLLGNYCWPDCQCAYAYRPRLLPWILPFWSFSAFAVYSVWFQVPHLWSTTMASGTSVFKGQSNFRRIKFWLALGMTFVADQPLKTQLRTWLR